MRLRRVIALLALLTAPLGAQGGTVADSARTDAAACDTAIARARVDSVRRTARAYLVRTDGGVLSRGYADLLLQEFGQIFRPPQPLRVPVFAPGPATLAALAPERRDTARPRELLLQGVYDFTGTSDGTVRDVRLRLSSLSPAFDSAVAATIEQLGRERALPLLSGEAAEDSVPLRLRITSGPEIHGRSRPLFVSTFPRIAIADAAAAADNPVPRYPALEGASGQEGYVLFQIVVNRQGRVQPGTIEVLQSTSPFFTTAALAVFDSLRFTPARAGDCAVPQVMQLPFRFVRPKAPADTIPSR